MKKKGSFLSFLSHESKVLMILAVYLVGGGLLVASEYTYYRTWQETGTQGDRIVTPRILQASVGGAGESGGESVDLGECANPEANWILCEDWEDGEAFGQDERWCTSEKFWEDPPDDCIVPKAWSPAGPNSVEWDEWYVLSAYCEDHCDGVVMEESNSGLYSLKMTNDPYCDCPDGEGSRPECEDGGWTCSDRYGTHTPALKLPINELRQVYARVYINRSDNYDVNYGAYASGKGFYLMGGDDNPYDDAINPGSGGTIPNEIETSFHFECRTHQGTSPTWGPSFPIGEPEFEDGDNYAVLTWYQDHLQCWGDDCFILPDPVVRCDELWPVTDSPGPADRQWHSIEIMGDIDNNTLAFWIDGVKGAEFSDVPQFYSNSARENGFDVLWLTNHYHHGVPELMSTYWDDLVVSTGYIGVKECGDSVEIEGACWCGVEPGRENTDPSLVYTEGYCVDGDWQADTPGGGGAVECGNNIKESDEVCDGTDLGSHTCVSEGFDSGELACAEDCLGFNTSECTVVTSCPDADGDGYESAACGGNDCDDTDANINHVMEEICEDGLDNNCDGEVDENCELPPLSPDVNNDGKVNIYDLVRVALNYGRADFAAKTDVIQDGQVDLADLDYVVENFD